MQIVHSELENIEGFYGNVNAYMQEHDFTLGGNWDYEHGYFDRSLDERNTVWLRIPFQVIKGVLDGEKEDSKTEVRIGQPFVLKHLYQDGLDEEAGAMVFGSLINQFQSPKDSDAEVESEWVQKAEEILKKMKL